MNGFGVTIQKYKYCIVMGYTPFTYLIGWSKLDRWYYGSRTARIGNCLYESGCHPDDLWKTYYTSSIHVKEFRQKFGEPDVIQIRKTFQSADECLKWEYRIIKRLKLANDARWLNRGDGFGGYNTSKPKSAKHREKLSAWQTGLKRGKCSEKTRKLISERTRGLKRSEATKLAMSIARRGKKKPCSAKRAAAICQGWKQREPLKCPHCDVASISTGVMTRWHFDNCKLKK